MAEATRPAAGGVNCYQSLPELKERKFISETIDISKSGGSAVVAFYDANHAAYICGIDLLWSNDASAVAAAIDVVDDTDSVTIVDGESLPQSASAGEVSNLTLETSGVQTAGQANGFFLIPAGNRVVASVDEAANTGEFQVVVTYVPLDKGV